MRERSRVLGAAGVAVLALALAAPARAASDTGTVAGTVRVEGTPPVRPPLEVYKHKEFCGQNVVDDRLVIGPAGGVRYVVLTVEGVRGGQKPDKDLTLTLDNKGCRFQPHVQVAEVGQWVEILNSDPVVHNADARIGKDTIFNIGLPPDKHIRRQLTRPGIVTITCDVWHTWMIGYIAVAEHPYHTVTDGYGAYEIRDLPPGSYRLRLWHEELGSQEKPFTVEAGQATSVDFSFPALDAAPGAPHQH